MFRENYIKIISSCDSCDKNMYILFYDEENNFLYNQNPINFSATDYSNMFMFQKVLFNKQLMSHILKKAFLLDPVFRFF